MAIIVYRIYCQIEGIYQTWYLDESDSIPTKCPVDTSHTVDLSSVAVINRISDNVVTIKEESVPTGGKWAAESHWFYGATGGISGPSRTATQITWDHDVSVFNVQYRSRDQNERDQLDMFVETADAGYGVGVIGIIQANAPTGATGISVSSVVASNVLVADYIALDDGSKSTDYLQVCDVDKNNNILYFFKDGGLSQNFDATTPTFIRYRRYVMRGYHLGPPDLYQLGNGKIGGSYVPRGNVVSVVYINNDSTTDKELFAYIERLE